MAQFFVTSLCLLIYGICHIVHLSSYGSPYVSRQVFEKEEQHCRLHRSDHTCSECILVTRVRKPIDLTPTSCTHSILAQGMSWAPMTTSLEVCNLTFGSLTIQTHGSCVVSIVFPFAATSGQHHICVSSPRGPRMEFPDVNTASLGLPLPQTTLREQVAPRGKWFLRAPPGRTRHGKLRALTQPSFLRSHPEHAQNGIDFHIRETLL
jgi:hypothetical protein